MLTDFIGRAKNLTKEGLALLLRNAPLPLTVSLLARMLQDQRADGGIAPAEQRPAGGRTITILALSPENFRGDLEALAATPDVRVITLSELWLLRLLYCFYATTTTLRMYSSFFDPTPDDPAYAAKRRYRAFLNKVLPPLFRRFGIDCVIGYHLHHVADVDWGAVSEQLGFPYVIIQRECLFASDHVARYTVERMQRLGRFEGAHVAVHNEVSVKTFETSGFVERDRMSILGAIRMDGYIRRLLGRKDPAAARPKATLFAFAVSSVYREEMAVFFADVHLTFVRLAQENPGVDFVIKYKNNVGPTWLRDFDVACVAASLDPTVLPNLTITGTADPQDLIVESSVVAGFNSTTLLEAGIAGKNVVVPLFDVMANPGMRGFLYFPDKLDVFNVAESLEAFHALVMDAVENHREVADDVMARRRAMFEEYVSSLDGDATSKHLLLLRDLVAARQSKGLRAGWVKSTDYATERP